MHLLRTRLHRDIVAEFLPPRRKSKRVIFIWSGMPGMPVKKELVEFFSKKGFWTFLPRYRGSWESGGMFLKNSPEMDVRDAIEALPKGFKDLWSSKRYTLHPKTLHLIGSSFGGPAAILGSRNPRVAKAIAFSPVVDWRRQSKSRGEPWGKLIDFTNEAFGEGYRIAPGGWQKLKKGGFYDPASRVEDLDGKKILIMHAEDDDIVTFGPVKKFAKRIGATFYGVKRGGHGAFKFPYISRPIVWKRITKFLND